MAKNCVQKFLKTNENNESIRKMIVKQWFNKVEEGENDARKLMSIRNKKKYTKKGEISHFGGLWKKENRKQTEILSLELEWYNHHLR